MVSVGTTSSMPDADPKRHQAADLLAQLARELSALVRRDVEVAASERLPALRRALLDATALAVVAVTALLALAALSVAGGRAADTILPGWAAVLVVAGAWALLTAIAAAVVLRPRTRPREREELLGLLEILFRDDRLEEVQSSRCDARAEAEAQVRQTSASLVAALLEEAAEHQLEALPAVAKREVGKAEADAAERIAEALAVLTAPARAGLSALGRLVELPDDRPDHE
jgi:Putative Actinobacterial Holin-X, holin superfamily III